MWFVSRCFALPCAAVCTHVIPGLSRRVMGLLYEVHAMTVLESKHVCDVGAEPGVTAGGAAARKLPRRGQGENPYPGQPVPLARAQGSDPQTRAAGPAGGGGSLRGV